MSKPRNNIQYNCTICGGIFKDHDIVTESPMYDDEFVHVVHNVDPAFLPQGAKKYVKKPNENKYIPFV